MMEYIEDEDIRPIWVRHAARKHGWASDIMPAQRPDLDDRFECGWHESEYQDFAAGYRAVFNDPNHSKQTLWINLLEAAHAYAKVDTDPIMIGILDTNMHFAIGKAAQIATMALSRTRTPNIVLHSVDQIEGIADGTLPVTPEVIAEMLRSYAALLK